MDLLNGTQSTLQTSWRGGLFPWPLTFRFTLCSFITPSCCLVCSFDTIYHPTDFTVTNETQKLWCIILDFMLYLLYGQKKKKHTTKQKHYRCKSRGFFSPSCIFLRCCKKKKRLYFSISLELLTVMQNVGDASVPSEHKADSGYSFYVFIKTFQRWNYILLFSV